MKKSLILLCVSIFTMTLVFTQNAGPNSFVCLDVPGNALRAFENAEQVVVAKIADAKKPGFNEKEALESITNTCDMLAPDLIFGEVIEMKSAVMVVEKAYKGRLKPGDKIEIQYNVCDPASRGISFLLYLDRPRENSAKYHISTGGCGARSGTVESAAEDILYLDNISKVKGKTRISGRITRQISHLYGASGSRDFSGKKIKIRSDGKVWELTTDSNGVFEIYNLPAGEYEIEPETPGKWRIEDITSTSSVQKSEDGPTRYTKTITVAMKKGEHASVKIGVIPDNAIRGRLLLPSGQPVTDVYGYVTAESVNRRSVGSAVVDSNGEFVLIVLREGKCVLIMDKINSTDEYSYNYYPGGIDRNKAEVFTIAPGAFFDIEFRIPELEKNTISVTARHSDGKTAHGTDIKFTFLSENPGIRSSTLRSSNIQHKDGKYHISIPKGVAGKLVGEIYFYTADLRNCQEGENLPTGSFPTLTGFRSDEVFISGKEDGSEDIPMYFPEIPNCE